MTGSSGGTKTRRHWLPSGAPPALLIHVSREINITVFSNGVLYMLHSSDGGFAYQYFGLANDFPLESV